MLKKGIDDKCNDQVVDQDNSENMETEEEDSHPLFVKHQQRR
jgi:hypothetical protein